MNTKVMTISINFQTKNDLSFDVKSYVIQVLDYLDVVVEHCDITCLNDMDMQNIHEQHLGSLSPTDTITFNLGSIDVPIGDIYVCPAQIKKNAREFNQAYDVEFKIVLIHSILHLIGYTDSTDNESKSMEEKQWQVFNALANYDNI